MHSVTYTPVPTTLCFLKVQICLVSINVTTTYNPSASKLKQIFCTGRRHGRCTGTDTQLN